MRGRLAFPLAGRAVVGGGDGPAAGSGSGLELSAGRDTAVRAVHPGRVVFVGDYLDFGLTAIVDHGDDFVSLYGRLARVEVRLGDDVPGGARVGWILRRGSHHPTLHFELRKGMTPIDARSWLGLE